MRRTNFFYTCLASILSNAGPDDNFFFHIVDGGLHSSTKAFVEKLRLIKAFEIEYRRVYDEEFKEFPLNAALSSKIYYQRLRIPDLFPNLTRILFLDVDIFVCASLRELYDTDIHGGGDDHRMLPQRKS